VDRESIKKDGKGDENGWVEQGRQGKRIGGSKEESERAFATVMNT